MKKIKNRIRKEMYNHYSGILPDDIIEQSIAWNVKMIEDIIKKEKYPMFKVENGKITKL